MKTFVKNNLIYFAVVVALILLWGVIALAVDNELILASPIAVVKETGNLFTSNEFYLSVGYTLLRSVEAFLLALFLAVITSLLAKLYPVVGKVIAPVVSVLRSTPTMSVILIALLLLSSNQVSVAVSFLIVYPVCYSALSTELNSTVKLDQMCKVFNVNVWDEVRYVYFPHVAKQLIEQLRSSLPLAVKVVIAGEVIAFPRYGIGREMYKANVNLMSARLLAYTVVAIVISFVIEVTVHFVFNKRAGAK